MTRLNFGLLLSLPKLVLGLTSFLLIMLYATTGNVGVLFPARACTAPIMLYSFSSSFSPRGKDIAVTN